LDLEYPSSEHFGWFPYLTHLICIIGLLVDATRPELGVSDNGVGEIQNAGYGLDLPDYLLTHRVDRWHLLKLQ